MIKIAAGSRDNVHHSASGGAVFCREGILEHRHFLNCKLREIGEHSLSSPTVIPCTAIHHKSSLPASGTVGRKQVLIHKHVTLVQRRTVGRIQQRQEGDSPIQKRHLFNLCFV